MSLHHEIEREQVYQDLESWYADIEPSYRDAESSSQDIESSGSSTQSLFNDQKTVKMTAAETSPLLAAAPDAPNPSMAPSMSLLRRVLLVTTMASAGLLNRFTVQATVIMLPAIGRAFSIPTSRQQMIFSTYSVASGSSMLLWGRMADVRGRWGVFLVGATTFALFTFLLPFSPSEPWLYLFQVLQGFSSAATVPSGIGILATTFPPGKERNLAFVALAASTTLGSVLGNIAGGAIGGLLSWKWGFWIPAAMAAVVALSAYALFPLQPTSSCTQHCRSDAEDHRNSDDYPDKTAQSVDYLGGILIFISLALLQVGLSQGNVDGWTNLHVPGLVGASIIVGYLFVILQLRMERSEQHPLVRLSMFKNTDFSAVFALTALFFGSFNGFLVFASMFFQEVQKLSMLETTYRFLPGGIIGETATDQEGMTSIALACFIVAPSLSAFRGFHILIFGITCSIISPLLFALPIASEGASFSYWARGFPAMCLCLSPEFVWPVIGLFVARSVPESDQSLAGALLQAANHVGRGLGLALATAAQVIEISIGTGPAPLLRGLQAAQWANIGMSVLSMAFTFVFFRGLGRA